MHSERPKNELLEPLRASFLTVDSEFQLQNSKSSFCFSYLKFRLPFSEYGFQHLVIRIWNSGFGFRDRNSNFHVLAHDSRPVAPLTTPSPGMVGVPPALSVSVSRLTIAAGAHPSTIGLARAARNRAREIAIARPPPGRLQTVATRAERPRPLPDCAQNDHSA